jgi:hypothetical protein
MKESERREYFSELPVVFCHVNCGTYVCYRWDLSPVFSYIFTSFVMWPLESYWMPWNKAGIPVTFLSGARKWLFLRSSRTIYRHQQRILNHFFFQMLCTHVNLSMSIITRLSHYFELFLYISIYIHAHIYTCTVLELTYEETILSFLYLFLSTS